RHGVGVRIARRPQESGCDCHQRDAADIHELHGNPHACPHGEPAITGKHSVAVTTLLDVEFAGKPAIVDEFHGHLDSVAVDPGLGIHDVAD
ncbi:MAG: hypothetical protein QOG79_1788, partial [Mycobacterium sp.]|nr:hypothetical protein [Mycobacterium sp.]